jgi:hypothetical protein
MLLDAAFHPVLDMHTPFNSLRIKALSKVGDEESYVLEKTLAQRSPVLDYVSSRTFLLLKREKPGETSLFQDYRAVDGEAVPFMTQVRNAYGDTLVRIKQVHFNVDVPPAVFHPHP